MRWIKKPFIVLISLFWVFLLINGVFAPKYYITHPTYFPSKSGSYITFDSSLLPISFNHLYKDSQVRWHFNNYWLTTTMDMSITSWFSNNWFNYTVSGVSTQEIYNGSKPSVVQFDGVNQTEGVTWSYSGGVTTINPTGTDVGVLWGGEPPEEPPESPEIQIVHASSDTHAIGNNFHLLIYENYSIGFQNGKKYLELKAITGDLNSSTNSLIINGDGGRFVFVSNESLTLSFNFTVDLVNVGGDEGKDVRRIQNGTSITIQANDIVTIDWGLYVEPWLPLMFIFGMFGIVSTIGGAMYSVSLLKKKQYDKGLTMGVIWVSVGVSFVLAWLWG